MSNAFMGQRQSASPFGFGGFSGGYSPPQMMEPSYGGFNQFGGFGGGFGGSPLLPPPQPTVNDLFSQYFSSQYYGGPAFNPFAATSFFGGGYGGGFGFGGGGGMGRGGRRRMRPMMGREAATIDAPPPSLSQLFASEFSPMQPGGREQRIEMWPVTPQSMPQPQQGSGINYAGGSPGFYERQQQQRVEAGPQPMSEPQPQPYMGGALPTPAYSSPSPFFASPFDRMAMMGGFR
jgi:hypothetical protein